MIPLLLGAAVLVALLAAGGSFSRAQIATIKAFGVWILAFAGVVVAIGLLATGRGAVALSALVMFGPLLWNKFIQKRGAGPARPGQGRGPRPNLRSSPMTRAEAYAVLGLKPGASEEQNREAHRRLMRAAHPDAGGSDWLASRINDARDILLP